MPVPGRDVLSDRWTERRAATRKRAEGLHESNIHVSVLGADVGSQTNMPKMQTRPDSSFEQETTKGTLQVLWRGNSSEKIRIPFCVVLGSDLTNSFKQQ